MYGILLLSVILLLLVLNEFTFIFRRGSCEDFSSNTKRIHKLYVKIANTPYLRKIGLMNRKEPLLDRHGLLFDYNGYTNNSFWMKNTYIPLDILFLDDSMIIIDYAENTIPMDLRKISSKVEYRYGIELNAGSIQKFKMNIGDKIKINTSYFF